MSPYRLAIFAFAYTTSFLVFVGCSPKKVSPEKALVFGQRTMQAVLPQMMQTLRKKVADEGAAKAVPYCREFAPAFGKEKNAEWQKIAQSELHANAYRFRRISLKNRNPKNAPDAKQAEILAQWANGKPTPAFYEQQGKYFTMHPIKIAEPLCLQCHGDASTIDPAAAAKIKNLYPEDKATGYKMGELRGAFVTELSY